MIEFTFSKIKALNGIVLLASKWKDLTTYHLAKIAYYADKEHLFEYGRPIFGDRYIAMQHGPVPSGIYDIIKIARGDSDIDDETVKSFIDVNEIDNKIIPKKGFDISLFSETEIKILLKHLSIIKGKDFGAIVNESHEEIGYKKADPDDDIKYEDIISELEAKESKELLEYINNGF